MHLQDKEASHSDSYQERLKKLLEIGLKLSSKKQGKNMFVTRLGSFCLGALNSPKGLKFKKTFL